MKLARRAMLDRRRSLTHVFRGVWVMFLLLLCSSALRHKRGVGTGLMIWDLAPLDLEIRSWRDTVLRNHGS